MSEEIKVGDIVSLEMDGSEVLVVSVFKTPNGTVMAGCEPLDAPKDQPIRIPPAELIRMN